jgi:RNA polymerase sigma factor (TIGR02999 family)
MPDQTPARPHPGEITRLLASIRAGDRQALNELFPLVYAELRTAAHRHLRARRAGDTLSTTALVHEAYLKFVGGSRHEWADRGHFLAVAARAMRQIVVDHARARSAQKRGGPAVALTLDEASLGVSGRADELLALDEALTQLEALNERPARVVELRFFAGLSVDETADAMELSPRTVKREWRFARAFLFDALSSAGAP